MISTKSIQELIKDPQRTGEIKDMIEKGRDQYGMQSFDQHLTTLYKSGQIGLDVAKASASNPSDFERALNFSDTSDDFESDRIGDLEDPCFVEDDPKPDAAAELGEDKEEEPVLELLDDAGFGEDDSLELA